MLRNYLKIAFRNIKRHKVYSFINIVGLAIGIACALLIFLWIQDEISYDRFHVNADDIYRLVAEGNNMRYAISHAPFAYTLKEEYPEVLKAVSRLTIVLVAVIIWILSLTDSINRTHCAEKTGTVNAVIPEFIPGSCTVFAASFGNTVLFGNNEDYKKIDLYYWVRPSGENIYGGMYLGFRTDSDNFSQQGGVNEIGLAFDFMGLPAAPLNNHPELPNRGAIINRIQQTCATVEEAIPLAKKYNWGMSLSW